MSLITNAEPIKIDILPLDFVGINRKDNIADNEISDGFNLGFENLPKISTRLPREKLSYSLTDPQDLFSAGGKLAWVDGTNFYYDGVLKGTVTAGKKSMVDFNGHIVIFPDKKYYCYNSANVDYDTFGSFTAPDLDYVTTHYNRVFGCKGDSIRGSKWGDFKTWDDFSGEADDSWAVDVVTKGNFTGIYTFQDHVIFFKSDYMTELYGTYPAQFQTVDVGKFGITDQRAVAEGNGYLLFVDKDGVKQYTGGVPRKISEKLDLDYDESALISDGKRFYLYNKDGTTDKIYVYDIDYGSWLPEDDLEVVAFTEIERVVYALDTDGNIWKFNSGSFGETEWGFTTKQYDMNSFFKKTVRKIKLRLEMDTNSVANVYVNINGEGFVKYGEYTNTDGNPFKEFYTLIDLRRANRFQIAIIGEGKAVVSGLVEYSFRSDKPVDYTPTLV